MKPAVVLAAATLGIALAASSSQASTPSRIVFAADRAATVTGEIWRVDPSGHRVDLSKSPWQDTNPAVSWDGRRVAFVSNRGGKTGVYEVAINGRGLAPAGLSLASIYSAGCQPQLAWQPRTTTLAVMACRNLAASLWLIRHGQKPSLLVQGKSGIQFGFAWSPQGLLAVPTPSGTSVYDAGGHLRWRKQLAEDSRPVWSPSGGLLGFAAANSTVVVTAGGSKVISKNTGRGNLAWIDDRRLAIGGYFGKCGCQAKILTVRTGAVTVAKSGNWFSPRSTDGKLAIVTPARKPGFSLGVAPPGGGSVKTYARIGGCYGDGDWTPAVSFPQLAGRSIVYQSWATCDDPFANLYSVAASGGSPHRLTSAQHQQTQPALSPDGSEIAYVWADANGLSCKGCSDGIRIASATGKAVRTLTNPDNCTFDDSPTWSPDGTTVLYAESDCSDAGELYMIPAAGGTPHDLGIRGREPAWGPIRIAYVGSDQSDRGLWTARPDGSDPVRVAKTGRLPAYSSSGALAYIARGSVVWDGNAHPLRFADIESLAWSPDGTRFVLVAKLQGSASFDLYTVKTDGTHPVRLTKNFGVLGAR